MALGQGIIEIRADVQGLRRDFSEAQRTFGTSMNRMVSSAQRLGGALGLYLGGRQLLNFARSSIQAAAEQEAAEMRLAASLNMIGEYSQNAMKDAKAFATEMQRVTTYDDAATLGLMGMGAALGRLSGKGLKDATIAAMGWAEIIGVDVTAAMNMLARAAQGNFTLWSRYTADIAKFNTAEEKMAFLLKKGAEGFEIQKARADTLQGSIVQAGNAWGEFEKQVGYGLAEGLDIRGMTQTVKDASTGVDSESAVRKVSRFGGRFVRAPYDVGKMVLGAGAAGLGATTALAGSLIGGLGRMLPGQFGKSVEGTGRATLAGSMQAVESGIGMFSGALDPYMNYRPRPGMPEMPKITPPDANADTGGAWKGMASGGALVGGNNAAEVVGILQKIERNTAQSGIVLE